MENKAAASVVGGRHGGSSFSVGFPPSDVLQEPYSWPSRARNLIWSQDVRGFRAAPAHASHQTGVAVHTGGCGLRWIHAVNGICDVDVQKGQKHVHASGGGNNDKLYLLGSHGSVCHRGQWAALEA